MNYGSVDAARSQILNWLSLIHPNAPTIDSLNGISAHELQLLARLGALIRAQLKGEEPEPLLTALTAKPKILVDNDIRTAFARLVEHDAVIELANLYASAVSPVKRRALGTFFTPREYAQAIVDGFASRHHAPAEVVDVGAGVGIFSEIAHDKWPDARIHAIDVNPITLGLQAVAVSKRPEWKVHLVLADYHDWLQRSSPSLPRLYLGNPPYTRWQLIDQSARAGLIKAAGGLVGARANLSTLFLAMTLAKLRPCDSLAMIIPAGWMRAEYGRKLRLFLREQKNRRVTLRMADSWRFEQAIVDAVLVEISPEFAKSQTIEVSDWSETRRMILSREDGEIPFASPGRHFLPTCDRDKRVEQLSSFARFTRGTASGANRFFVGEETEWDALGVPKKYRRKLARRLRPGTDSSAPTVETSELLVLKGYQTGSIGRIDGWIADGKAEGVNESHLCSRRSRWFDLSSEVKCPDVIVSALARDKFHVVENSKNLVILNNLFGLYWKPKVTPAEKTSILAWLRSREGQLALRSNSSVEANGLHRLSPKMMGSIIVSPLGVTGAEESLNENILEGHPLAGNIV